jgi:hypothetical protein
MSLFSQASSAAGAAISGIFGEAIVIAGQSLGRISAGVDDALRPARPTRAVLTEKPAADGLFDERKNGASAIGPTRIVETELVAQIQSIDAEAIGYRPARGDKVTLSERPGAPVHIVGRVEDDDIGTVWPYLSRRGA